MRSNATMRTCLHQLSWAAGLLALAGSTACSEVRTGGSDQATNPLDPIVSTDNEGPGTFNVTGLTGGDDATADAWLGDGSEPILGWTNSLEETGYEVTIESADGSSVICPAETVGTDVLTLLPSGCALSNAVSYRARVVATGTTGNRVEADNSPFAFTVDQDAPTASVSSGPADPTSSTGGSVAFSATDGSGSGVTGYRCSVDGGAFSACASPLNLSGLAEGPHTVAVRALDAAANVSADDTHAWTVDLTPPSAFAVSGITGGSDAAADNLLADGLEATLSWANAANESEYRVTILESDGSTVKCALATEPADTLLHVFTGCALTPSAAYFADLRARDAAGNERVATGSPFAFTVAGPPPGGFAVLGARGGADSLDDAWLGNSPPTLRWTDATGEASYRILIENSDGSSTICAQETEPADAVSHAFGAGCSLANGTVYRARVSAVNSEGTPTEASNSPFSFTVDATPPSEQIDSGPATLTQSTSASIAFSGADAASGLAGFRCSVDGGAFGSCASPLNLSGLPEGPHSVEVRALDTAGNESAGEAHGWTIDLTPPAAFAVSGITGGTDLTIDDLLANGLQPTVNWADTTGESEYRVIVYEDDGSTVACPLATPAADSTSQAFSACTLAAGTDYLADVRARDSVGNERVATGSPFAFRTALPPPAAFTLSGISGGPDTAVDAWLGNAPPTVRWIDTTGEDHYDVAIENSAGTIVVCAAQTAAAGATLHDMGGGCVLSDGTSYRARVVAVNADSIGTEGTNSPLSFTVDRTAPTAQVDSGPPAVTQSSSAAIAFSGSDAASGLAGFECSVDGGAYGSCTSPLNLSSLSEAAHTVDVRSLDAAGNVSAPASHAWTVDATPPAPFAISGITGGADSTPDALLGDGFNPTVSWADTTGESEYRVSVYDNNGTTIRCAEETKAADSTSHAFSGCTLTAGFTYRARVRALDAAGNESVASNALFAFSVSGGAPDRIAISGSGAVATGDCMEYSIQSHSPSDVQSAGAANVTVTLTVNNGTGTFYTASDCATSATTAVITAGTSAVSRWFRSVTAPQSLTLVGTSATLSAGSKAVAVGGNPTALLISGLSDVAQGDCEAYEVARVDSFGNRIADDTATTVDLSEDGNVSFHSDAACSGGAISQVVIPANQQLALIYADFGAVESVTLAAADNAAALTAANKLVNAAAASTWWNASWGHRVRATIDNLDQTAAFTDMPVLLKLNGMRVDYSLTQNAGQDIRVVAADDSTQLLHQIEKWDEAGTSLLWVRLPSIPASSDATFVYVYYDNPGASDDQGGASLWSQYWGVWHLGENPGASAPQYSDSSAGARHGTAVNSPARVAAAVGDGAAVLGADDTIDVGTGLVSVIGATSTFSAWLKTNQVGHNTMWQAPGITGVESAGDGNDIFFGWIDGTGRIGVTAGNGAAAKSNFVVNDNAWRHVTITRNSTSGAVQFFVNGVLNGSGTSEAGLKTASFTRFGWIGDTGGTPVDLDGALDEIRIYNAVQSADRIRADYKYQNDTHVFYSEPEAQ
ncbi:MAG: DUF2341 domain-containing protein [Bdellovibrionales bacterium]|nr:DUF2341 domain-containing protein [Bdellovibrionales bacterium]